MSLTDIMNATSIKSRFEQVLQTLQLSEQDLIVLKGISPSEIFGEEINLSTVVTNKLNSFIQFSQSKRKYLTFDEYLVLEKFVLEQYKRIVIIENNLYSSYYPLELHIEQNILDALQTHFDKEIENNEQEIGDLSRYLEIYANLQCINNKYYVVYNPIGIASNYTTISLWAERDNLQQENKSTSDQIHTIYAELDYLDLIIKVQNENCASYFLRIEAENEIKQHYLRKIFILAEVYNSTKFILSQSAPYQYVYKKRSEFKDILKKYWGYNDFRTLKCYDIAELENGTKKIVHVSQEEVVTVVIEQCEKCFGGETFKDVFVTAPTGAGKSVMFQVPAIFLAENHQLLTIVISPLIGLMKDQVASLKIKNYNNARTINSDINPILKQEIIEEVKEGACNILYISPETLLSRSDIEMLIGERKIGLLVVDEAHIVTTWGKQFRPDYWYLGDHVAKLRKKQKERKGHSFVVATFTATSIYGGIENMYQDTKDSLNLFTPLTYLGIVRREDLDVVFERSEKIPGRDEYELRKFEQLAEKIEQAIILNKRVLVYFPTVQLIKRFYRYCHTKDFYEFVTIYHGQMDKYEKDDSFNEYITRKKIVMLATKAFGMGIDIDDIELVLHFAPTGNVCDYIQEIGRAARRTGLSGTAHYNFMSNDFKHINRLHGLSAIQHYQLIEVIRKILELFREQINSPAYTRFTRRRNELLVDATSFSHVFENDFTDESNAINKVKTAMLIIQKDFENRQGFSPFFMRPIPLFSVGYFKIAQSVQDAIIKKYGHILKQVDEKESICEVNLKCIWETLLAKTISFAMFKYQLYTQAAELDFAYKKDFIPAIIINVYPCEQFELQTAKFFTIIEDILIQFAQDAKFYSLKEIGDTLVQKLGIKMSRTESITGILVATIKAYTREFNKSFTGRIYTLKPLNSGEDKIMFSSGIENYLNWIKKTQKEIFKRWNNGAVYVVNENQNTLCKEFHIVLGLLESFDLLAFQSLGGNSSQISIYINSTKTMFQIVENPRFYKNAFLEKINLKHEISVEMLTYLYNTVNSSKEFWDNIEDYFLGKIPETVKLNYEKKNKKELPVV